MFDQIVELTENNDKANDIKTYIFKDANGNYLVSIPDDSLSIMLNIERLEILFDKSGLNVNNFKIKFYNEFSISERELKLFLKFTEE